MNFGTTEDSNQLFTTFKSMIDAQSQFLQLRLVCHRFNEDFMHQGLPRGLLLPPFLVRKQSLPSLLTWLPQYGASVERFAAICNTVYFEAVLKKLMPPQTTLNSICLSNSCSPSPVLLMSGLTSLTSKIRNSGDTIDLTPVKKLEKLQKLLLTGNFRAYLRI